MSEKIIKKLLPNLETKVGGGIYSTWDVRKILQAIDQTKIKRHKKWPMRKLRARAMIHVLASSGIRLGNLVDLKRQDVEPIQDCYKLEINPETRYQYTTFVTPESRKALDEYLQTCDNQKPDDSLFEISYDAARLCLYRLVKKAKVSTVTVHEVKKIDRLLYNKKNPRHRLDIPTIHGLRKRWNTIMKSNIDINPNLIEMMLGHSLIKLDESYLKPTTEKLYEEYKKGIKELTVFKDNL